MAERTICSRCSKYKMGKCIYAKHVMNSCSRFVPRYSTSKKVTSTHRPQSYEEYFSESRRNSSFNHGGKWHR